jgi:poly-gamma-glutamate synthesis protein (capsule biosynthesis protein)
LKRTKSSLESPRLFAGVKPLLDSADVNVINFEGVATNAFVPHTSKSFLLKMPLSVPAMLSHVGVDVALLANNHAMDFGFQGLYDTVTTLREAGMAVGGAGADLAEALKPVILGAGGRSVCLLAFSRTLPESFWATETSPGTAYVDFDETARHIERCKDAGHFTIANFHWGQELKFQPKKYQRDLARVAIRAGADTVIGHHPHVLQSVEIYRGRPIFYSLGNFHFGSMPVGRPQQGMAVGIRFPRDTGPLVYRLVPMQVTNEVINHVPRLFKDGEADPLEGMVPLGPCEKTGTHYECRF